jgi:phage terminase large subunit
MYRRGNVARVIHAVHKQDTMETAGQVARLLTETNARSAKIDVVGIGAGVFDRLRELRRPVREASAGNAAHDKERFINARAEWYWNLREQFESGDIDIDPHDEELAAQLSGLRYFVDSRGRIGIESKDDMKKRGLPSPDRADTLAIVFGRVEHSLERLRALARA